MQGKMFWDRQAWWIFCFTLDDLFLHYNCFFFCIHLTTPISSPGFGVAPFFFHFCHTYDCLLAAQKKTKSNCLHFKCCRTWAGTALACRLLLSCERCDYYIWVMWLFLSVACSWYIKETETFSVLTLFSLSNWKSNEWLKRLCILVSVMSTGV